jgi:hypothetical protein
MFVRQETVSNMYTIESLIEVILWFIIILKQLIKDGWYVLPPSLILCYYIVKVSHLKRKEK